MRRFGVKRLTGSELFASAADNCSGNHKRSADRQVECVSEIPMGQEKAKMRLGFAPALSPGKRGNFSGVAARPARVDAPEHFGTKSALASKVYALPDRDERRGSGRPRTFLPLPGGEGRGEGESRRPFAFRCCCELFEAQAEFPKGITSLSWNASGGAIRLPPSAESPAADGSARHGSTAGPRPPSTRRP